MIQEGRGAGHLQSPLEEFARVVAWGLEISVKTGLTCFDTLSQRCWRVSEKRLKGRRRRRRRRCGSSRWWCSRGAARWDGSPHLAVATSCDPPSAPPGWRRSQLSPSYPFAEEWVLKKVFAVEFVDYLVGYEALECLGDTADIPYPVGLHELAGKHLGMVGFGNPL